MAQKPQRWHALAISFRTKGAESRMLGRVGPSRQLEALRAQPYFFFDRIILFMSSVDGGTMPDTRR